MPAPPAAVAPARIALLLEPFGVNGVPPERLHLVQGFRHDLIACLVRFREWFVVDGPAMPAAAQAGARVSGRYRISATAYQAGARISMVLTLAEQDTGIFVWSERLSLELEGWFEAQQRILRRIAASLNTQLSVARMMRIAAEPDLLLDGHDRWLRGQAMILGFGTDPRDGAIPLLRETVARTPGFAPAWSSLAQALNSAHIGRPGLPRDRAREEEGLAHARRAVQLDPTDSRAHLCLSWALAMADRHAHAETNLRLALELNPYDSWTLISAAMIYAFAGQHATAWGLASQSLEMTLAPGGGHWNYHGTIAFLRGEDEAAADYLDRAEEVIASSQAWRAAALAHLGRLPQAREAAARFLGTCRARWRGAGPATDRAITAWMLREAPVALAADWTRLRDGLRRAGLPAEGLAHADWYAPLPED